MRHPPTRGGGHNRSEANAVVAGIVSHYRRTPNKSLGVVAFNKRQAEEIDLLLDQIRRTDPALDKLISQSSDSEPLFIKNLENVQGDERDVIFISVTYGPERPGERTFQRFGPINSDVGWRRLNVIATRAKERVEVFTSMRPTDVLIGERTLRGVRELRNYLEYAATGSVKSYGQSSGRAPDSDFEEAVGTIVKNLGYEIEPQVGAEGFFIDIGIRHPDRNGEFLMGLECDGMSYHSSPSVRDRDRLRQEILESKGWFIHRIWSTSWFHARTAEIERLSKVIEQRLATERRAAPPLSQESTTANREEPVVKEALALYQSADESTGVSISEALNRFWEQNIKPQFPERQNGILSEEMVTLLSRHRPTTKDKWSNDIPLVLRDKLDSRQLTFLPDIFDLINEYV
ncbi:AAA family ATPase [bacterium AH-315-O15]|nr:AAA family ATPase [bacterium AH-315-O15]